MKLKFHPIPNKIKAIEKFIKLIPDNATNPDKQGKYESLIIIEIGLNPDKNSASIIRGKIKKYNFKGFVYVLRILHPNDKGSFLRDYLYQGLNI